MKAHANEFVFILCIVSHYPSNVVAVLSTQPSADAEVTVLMDKCCNLFCFDD